MKTYVEKKKTKIVAILWQNFRKMSLRQKDQSKEFYHGMMVKYNNTEQTIKYSSFFFEYTQSNK